MSDYTEHDYDDADVDFDDERQDDEQLDDAPGGSWEPDLRAREQRPRGKGKKGKRRSGLDIPANAPRPQDHKKSAAQREADGDATVEIVFRGEKFRVAADMDDWHVLAVQAFSRGRNIDAIEMLLGPRQWARYLTKFSKKRDFDEFAELVAIRFGFGAAGN